MSEYILDTDVVLDHLPASSYAKFVRSCEHPEALIALYGLANSFYKKSRSLQRGVPTVHTIPYKSKFNTKIGRYPAMSFIAMRFKERNLQRHFWTCVRPYDGSFLKIGEVETWRISDSKGVNVFQSTPWKGVVVVFKIKQDMWIVNSKLIKSMPVKLKLKKFSSTNSSQLNIQL